ncbi:MAG: hypothetical protein LBD23_02030 [Oscillospiraceae bacterium]|nr:hypothetical protein [Oscillospiraceae bacterium]
MSGLFRKYFFTLLPVLLLFLLSGCIRFDVELGIDEYNTAFLSYNVDIDVDGFDSRQQSFFLFALQQVAFYYHNELEFSVSTRYDENPYGFTASKRIANSSFEQAFRSLESMVTDEAMSIFMQVDMDYLSSERLVGYVFGAVTDIGHILRSSNINELPPSVLLQLVESFEEGSGNIQVSFPADELVDFSHDADVVNGRITMSVPLDFINETEFSVAAKLNLLGSGNLIHSLRLISDTIDKQLQLRAMAVIACFMAVFLLFIALLILITRRRRRR